MDHQEMQGPQEAMDAQGNRDPRDHPDSPANQETQDPRDHPAPLESSDQPHQPQLAALDSPVAQVLLDPQERVDALATMAAQGTQEPKETEAALANLVVQEAQDPQEPQGTLAPQEAATTAHQLVWRQDIRPSSSCNNNCCERNEIRLQINFERSNFGFLLGLCALNLIAVLSEDDFFTKFHSNKR
jgi:hypothetical protein